MRTTLTQARPGVFISFEGCDGSGKSTQISRIAHKLESTGMKFLVTREPGGTPLGERIRQLLLDPQSPDRSLLSETFLYAAARAEFVSRVVRPALAKGLIVITERYTDSTWVYQGYAGGISFPSIENINTIATGGLETDLTLILDIDDSSIIDKRLALRQKDKIESRSGEYHERVREGYKELARRFPDRTVCVNAALDVCATESAIWKEITRVLAEKGMI